MSASSRSPCWPARRSCSTRSSIPDRLVSLADPDARPMRKGRPRHPTQFGYTLLVAETSAASSPTTSSSGATHRMRPSWSHRCSGWWRSLPGRPARWSATAASAPPPTTKRWKSWRQAGRPAAHRHPRQGTAGVGADPSVPAAGQLAGGHRGPHQPPQAQLRAAPDEAAAAGRSPHLGRVGDLRLQPAADDRGRAAPRRPRPRCQQHWPRPTTTSSGQGANQNRDGSICRYALVWPVVAP
jgi:hypothetical protein